MVAMDYQDGYKEEHDEWVKWKESERKNMTFETYDPTKHTLEVGTKIRLAGREGEIVKLYACGETHMVRWPAPYTGSEQELYLAAFPELQIAVSPLTIDKRVKEEIEKIAMGEYFDGPYNHEMVVDRIRNYLNSLKET